jgi:predicted transcriptional regulator
MIDFACKSFDLKDVVKCGLGLSKADCKVCMHLIRHMGEEFTTEEIGRQTRLTLSTVQRAVKKLHEKGVIFRHQENLEGGGYQFTYRSKGKPEIRRIISEIIDGWTKSVDDALQKW